MSSDSPTQNLAPELSSYTFGFSLFAVIALAAWATAGSFGIDGDSDKWAMFHRCTPFVALVIAAIAITLLMLDYL